MRRNRKDLRLRNVHAVAGARGAVEELADAVVVAVAVEVALVPVAGVALRVVDRAVAREVKEADAAVRAVVGGVKAKAATAMADAETVEASS
jgi:hypothetical protein